MSDDNINEPTFYRVTNREIWDAIKHLEKSVDNQGNLIANVLGENVELRKRVRRLELYSYAVISGLSTGIVVLLRISGVPL